MVNNCISPAEGSSEQMSFLSRSNWGWCFPWHLVQVWLEGRMSWPCLLGISFRDQLAAVLFPAAWQETVCVMLTWGGESCSGFPLLTVSCWPPQQVVVLVCSISLWLSRWELVLCFTMLGTSLLPQSGTYSNEMNLAGVGRHSTLLRAMTPFPEGYTLIFFSFFPAWEWCQEGGERSWEVGVRSVHWAAARQSTLQACKHGSARQHQTGCGSREGSDFLLPF